MNAAFPMGVNINRSHKLFGWGTQIRGVENGGAVINLPVHTFPTDDGSVAMKCPTEVAIDDRREAELAKLGLMPILHRKNTDIAAFIGAHSLQDDEARAGRLVDPDAQANERLSANLPYLFPVSRFAHYLKAIARDKVGSFKERADMQVWLTEWINRYVLANPAFADDKARAKRPLAAAEVQVDSVEGRPGYYAARFYLRPHYQLEGINASLRLVSELPSVKHLSIIRGGDDEHATRQTGIDDEDRRLSEGARHSRPERARRPRGGDRDPRRQVQDGGAARPEQPVAPRPGGARHDRLHQVLRHGVALPEEGALRQHADGRGGLLGAAHHRGRDQRLSGGHADRRLGDELRDAARPRTSPT